MKIGNISVGNGLTVHEMLDLARFYHERAEYFAKTGDDESSHAFEQFAQDWGAAAELVMREGLKNTIGHAPDALLAHSQSLVAMKAIDVGEEVNQYRQNSLPSATDPKTEQEKEKVKKINYSVVQSVEDAEVEILSRKKDNNQQTSFAQTYRATMCKMIARGQRNELATILTDYTFKSAGYSWQRAQRFITAVKEQFNVPEPSKKLKQWDPRNIPINKWVYAKYTLQRPDSTKEREGFLKRHKRRNEEMLNENEKFECYVADVEKWRFIFQWEKDQIIKPPF